jgi:microcystin-dependent protein
MSLEAATYITDLDANNPTPTDLKSQGDDHIRLIKSVLKNTFPGANAAASTAKVVAKSANYTAVAADDNTTFVCDTSLGSFTITLPTLGPSVMWTIRVQKTTSDANAVFIVPPSGTINSYAKIRRSAENLITSIMWNGLFWAASRPFGAPIGACIEFYGSTLPNGYLWPDGATFVAADFTELNVVLIGNIKPDRRGRVAVARDDIGGVAANRVTTAGSGINGVALGANGGAQNVVLDGTMVPNHTHTITDPGHTHNLKQSGFGLQAGGLGLPVPDAAGVSTPNEVVSNTTGISVNATTGGGGSHTNMPPAMVANFILVAE